jgi:phosphate uptake regulator
MPFMASIEENLKFLVVEVQGQVNLTFSLLYNSDTTLAEKIVNKDDYVDNLKNTIENRCFSRIHSDRAMDDKELRQVRSVHIICVNLERIGDFFVNIARQTQYLSDFSTFHALGYREMFTEVQQSLSRLIPVIHNHDLAGALDICKAELNLDRMYKSNFDSIMEQLRSGRNVENLITSLFIFRYLERVGDSLLNIGEALIFAIIGDRIKIRQFEALRETLAQSGFEGTLSDIDFQAIWGSRSGCRIGKINPKDASGFSGEGIFKEGDIHKVRGEKDNMQKWEQIRPGLVPKVFGYHEDREKASLLVEFLPGRTLDEVLLTENDETLGNAFNLLKNTLDDVWQRTLQNRAVSCDYMKQLQSRIGAVCSIHPSFCAPAKRIGGLRIPPTLELLEECAEVEKSVYAPFTVFIHGDFNVNNVFYNQERHTIHYVDVHRSRQADYVQDASVFVVSNFRLPIFEIELRRRLNTIIASFLDFVCDFAERNGDETFELRMALALVRSFYTSTRFELHEDFAKEMYLRSLYLMERIAKAKEAPFGDFSIPTDVLYY